MNERGFVFETDQPVLFSALVEKKLGLVLQWRSWQNRVFFMDGNGLLSYRKNRSSSVVLGKFNLRDKVRMALVEARKEGAQGVDVQQSAAFGISVACRSDDGKYDAFFRCVLNEDELVEFIKAIEDVSRDHNMKEITEVLNSRSRLTVDQSSYFPTIMEPTKGDEAASSAVNSSVMRRSIAMSMNQYDTRTVREKIMSHRKLFKFLPVLFSNDLIHGSWWFVIGSVSFLVSSAVILENSYSLSLGEDDSVLTPSRYRATWVLMIVAAAFFTLGSMAFVRALQKDPPMKPLFPDFYHFSNDELLASWLFLLGVLPLVPYCLVYMSGTGSSGENHLLFTVGLVLAVILVCGMVLFVRSCYPSAKGFTRQYIKILTRVACFCFCSQKWMDANLSNDWLAGCWIIYWGEIVFCFVCFVLVLDSFVNGNDLQIFMYATAFLENLCFLIGAAYFIAGSYPEQTDSEKISITHAHAEADAEGRRGGGNVNVDFGDDGDDQESETGDSFEKARGRAAVAANTAIPVVDVGGRGRGGGEGGAKEGSYVSPPLRLPATEKGGTEYGSGRNSSVETSGAVSAATTVNPMAVGQS